MKCRCRFWWRKGFDCGREIGALRNSQVCILAGIFSISHRTQHPSVHPDVVYVQTFNGAHLAQLKISQDLHLHYTQTVSMEDIFDLSYNISTTSSLIPQTLALMSWHPQSTCPHQRKITHVQELTSNIQRLEREYAINWNWSILTKTELRFRKNVRASRTDFFAPCDSAAVPMDEHADADAQWTSLRLKSPDESQAFNKCKIWT